MKAIESEAAMIAKNGRQENEPQDTARNESGPRVMLNEKQVLQIVPVGHATLWRLVAKGRFPKGTFISPNRKVWFADEITAWQTEIEGQGRPKA